MAERCPGVNNRAFWHSCYDVGGRPDLLGKACRNGPEQRDVWPRFSISDAQFRSRLVVRPRHVVLNGPHRDWVPANQSTATGSVAPPCACSRPCSATVPTTGHRQQRCGTFSGGVHLVASLGRHFQRKAHTEMRRLCIGCRLPRRQSRRSTRLDPLPDVVVDAVPRCSKLILHRENPLFRDEDWLFLGPDMDVGARYATLPCDRQCIKHVIRIPPPGHNHICGGRLIPRT
jgi:hypothetical protein